VEKFVDNLCVGFLLLLESLLIAAVVYLANQLKRNKHGFVIPSLSHQFNVFFTVISDSYTKSAVIHRPYYYNHIYINIPYK
jgi:hypothetical protein